MTNARTARSAREKAAEMRQQAARQEARRRTVIVTSAVVAVVAVLLGVGLVIQNARTSTVPPSASTTPANVSDGGIVVGRADAKVTVTVYEDFQCPVCKSFEDANAAQLDAWLADGTAKLVYKPIAFLDRASSTKYSTRSLNAAAAVVNAAPSAFPAFHQSLFAEQPPEGGAGLTDARLVELAAAAGAPKEKVAADVKALTFEPWVKKTTDDASKAGVTGTPTVLVDGKRLDDFGPASLAAAVKKAAR